MDRRGFLGRLFGGIAAVVAAPFVKAAPLVGFKSVGSYGTVAWTTRTSAVVLNDDWLMQMEIGRVEGFRFIQSRISEQDPRWRWRLSSRYCRTNDLRHLSAPEMIAHCADM